ncbi:MAG TPA: NFACT family protein [Bacteroidota bacterium]|nr:NFACT family protein [Bacteroidota bacterium]
MISNYYTLRVLAEDLSSNLRGGRIQQIFSQEKDELILQFTPQSEREWVVVRCDPARNALYARREFHRAKRNSIDLLPEIVGSTVEAVAIHPFDRIFRIQTHDGNSLMIELFGSKANVLVVDGAGKILAAFLRPKDLVGISFEEHTGRHLTDWQTEARLPDQNEFEHQLTAIGHVSLFGALKKILPQFGSVLLKEVLFRAGIAQDAAVAQLTTRDREGIFNQAKTVHRQLTEEPYARLYYENKVPILFSLISLQHLQGLEEHRFPSVHEAIRTMIASSGRQKSFFQVREDALRKLRQAVEKTERTLKKVEEEAKLLERAGEYELYAKLLMANLSSLAKGMKEATLENLYSPSRERVTIPLEPSLLPSKNAERYFEKAKKSRRAFEESKERIDRLHEEWEMLNELMRELETIQTEDRFREFLSRHERRLTAAGIRSGKQKEKEERARVPFRVFAVEGGFTVWVGKSNENNDLLTLKYAKPNDLWFHVRAASGSHVVLKMETGKGEPGKRTLEQAAAIAAYYSKMKTAKHVPVAMTLKKYVRKPKGAPAGTVTIEREKLIFVDPGLPNDSKNSVDEKSERFDSGVDSR